MLSRLLILALAAAALVLCGDISAATAEEWPAFQPNPGPGTAFRGPGYYMSFMKIISCWLVFLIWVRTADWVNRDCQEMKLPFFRWNPIVFGPFVTAFVLLWLIPSFWLGFPLLLIALIAPVTSYVVVRNGQVTNDRRVFTREHIRYWLSVKLAVIGIKIEAKAPDPHEVGPPARLIARGAANERQDSANLLAARQTPGVLSAREILADALSYRASAVMLDYTQQGVGVRLMIDGVWLNRPRLEREQGDPALESLKTLCGLKPQDRQSRQTGTFGVDYEAVEYSGTLTSQGTKTGERVMIQLIDEKIRFETLDDLGMRPKIQEQLAKMLATKKGIMLMSAIPGGGLRSTADIALRHTDRLLREFMAVEEETNRYQPVENCPVTTYKASDGQSPADILTKVFRQQPDVVVIRDLVNAETVQMLCHEVAENRFFISTVRAKDCAEALMRIVAMGVPAAEFAVAAAGVMSQRLVRKLCDNCKEAYVPTPQVLQQLGIPEGKVPAFHRPPQQVDEKEICQECSGIGYKGRTAIFELLSVGQNVRQVLAGGGTLDLLRKAARKDGMRSLQEEGILMVAKGITSLPELMRVMKQ